MESRPLIDIATMVTNQNQHESHIIATYDMFSGDVIDMVVSRRRK